MSLKSPVRLAALLFFLTALLSLPLALGAANAEKESHQYIEIHKSARILLLKNGNGTVKSYHIAIGSGGSGDKKISGDMKTPTGKYRVAKIRESDGFHLFLHINYPNLEDAKAGYRTGKLTFAEFMRIFNAVKRGEVPPQNTVLGGHIGIHGIGRTTEKKLSLHRDENWTRGCIAMTNEEVSELGQIAREGMLVKISD